MAIPTTLQSHRLRQCRTFLGYEINLLLLRYHGFEFPIGFLIIIKYRYYGEKKNIDEIRAYLFRGIHCIIYCYIIR